MESQRPTAEEWIRFFGISLTVLTSHPVEIIGFTDGGLPVWRCTDHGGVHEGRWYWSFN